MPSFNDVSSATLWQHPVQWTTASMSAGTMTAGWITGAPIVVLNNSGATPGTQTTRTAALMLTDFASMHTGYSWLLVIFNSVTTNTFTLAAGSGVTLSGTTTVLPFSARVYNCVVTNYVTPAITITGIFSFGLVGGSAVSAVA